MLFNNDIDPCCSYCRSGSKISSTEVACLRRGVVEASGSCPRFKYDPLKRMPSHMAPLRTDKFKNEDFSL